jgi:hypothetical protein
MGKIIALHTAALLTLAIAAAHSYLGERYIPIRLFRRDNLPKLFGSAGFTIRTLRFVWQLLTVTWIGLAIMMKPKSPPIPTPVAPAPMRR